MWVLGMESGSSGRVASAHNHCAISLALEGFLEGRSHFVALAILELLL